MNYYIRDQKGFTLPFALILTFIFSALVSVSYVFVSINLRQMQSSVQNTQAISIAEGINERIKARLNTKRKIKQTPNQEQRLKSPDTAGAEPEEDDEDLLEDEFNEETEDFDEYYADEVLKISRYIVFREPPEKQESADQDIGQPSNEERIKPEANVESIGSISIPQGTILEKGTMIVVFKDEKIDLNLKDIAPDTTKTFREKLPVPVIQSLSPNYDEANKRSSFVVLGKNITYSENARFTNKEIYIEDIRSGPLVEFLISMDVKPGLTKFYWENVPAEFYIIPTFDGSPRPSIAEIKTADGNQLMDIKAGQKRLILMIAGIDLYQKKSPPVVIPDIVGLIPKVKEYLPNGKTITISLDIDKLVEPGIHSLAVATEGGLSNAWVFNILPPDEKAEFSANTAIVTSGLTLLEIRVLDKLLPLIDENEDPKQNNQNNQDNNSNANANSNNNDADDNEPTEPPEGQKLGPFANVDLETVWLLQTTAMVGKVTKTISEVIQRQLPIINAAVITNGNVAFDGGGFQINGSTTAMTGLIEPTFISNTELVVGGPPKETELSDNSTITQGVPDPNQPDRPPDQPPGPKSPAELGFAPGSFVATFKEGDTFYDLDYGIINSVERDRLTLVPPGLMEFHYEGDSVVQFIPPLISKDRITDEEGQKHLVPPSFSLGIPNFAKFKNIFKSNLEQFADLADLYTNDQLVPKDEFDLPLGYMGLSYVAATPLFDESNTLSGKGVLIIDTASENQGRPSGEVQITGDSKSPINFSGILYIRGNVRIDGNVTLNGALVVDNDTNGMIQISSSAIGMITWDPRIIKQSILSIPFSTKPGTVKINSKPIDLTGYIQGGTEAKGTDISIGKITPQIPLGVELPSESTTAISNKAPEEALIEANEEPGENKKPIFEPIPDRPSEFGGGESKSAEEELIDLF